MAFIFTNNGRAILLDLDSLWTSVFLKQVLTIFGFVMVGKLPVISERSQRKIAGRKQFLKLDSQTTIVRFIPAIRVL